MANGTLPLRPRRSLCARRSSHIGEFSPNIATNASKFPANFRPNPVRSIHRDSVCPIRHKYFCVCSNRVSLYPKRRDYGSASMYTLQQRRTPEQARKSIAGRCRQSRRGLAVPDVTKAGLIEFYLASLFIFLSCKSCCINRTTRRTVRQPEIGTTRKGTRVRDRLLPSRKGP